MYQKHSNLFCWAKYWQYQRKPNIGCVTHSGVMNRNQQTAGTTKQRWCKKLWCSKRKMMTYFRRTLFRKARSTICHGRFSYRYFCLLLLSYDMNNIYNLPYMWRLTPFTPCFAAKGFDVWFSIRKKTCPQVLSSESGKNQFAAVKLYSNTRTGDWQTIIFTTLLYVV